MVIALYVTETIPPAAIASALADEGVEVRAFDASTIGNIQTFGPEISKAVLIVPKHGAGDPTTWFRSLLPDNRPLILCSQQPEHKGYERLKRMGASVIIAPRTWKPEHVAERILGQLILDGDIKPDSCGKLRGGTQIMRDAYAELSTVATLDDPVLLTGETGTGKELLAREVHNLSGRPGKLVSINCGELNKELAGSELFGHEKGSFTGAVERPGLLMEAKQGTVFLDEIGELDFKAQAFLLRVLEDRKVRRVGSNQTEEMTARVILATNRDLEFECEREKFRQDLFERIRGFSIELAPLRKRRADLPLLALHFLEEFCKDTGKKIDMPPAAFDFLFTHDWPGNVRELRAAIRRAAAFSDNNGYVSVWQLTQTTRRSRRPKPFTKFGANAEHCFGFDPRVDTWKRFSEKAHVAYFEALLKVANGNRKEALRLSGLSSSQFYENLKTFSRLREAESDDELDQA